jgi:formiminotetrahydrofolate cyclodeaminase
MDTLQAIGTWVSALGAKKPTPGGGAAAAVAGAIGAAAALILP